MFVNNVQNRKSNEVKSEEDQPIKMMDQAVAMQERAQPNAKDTLLLNSKEPTNQSNSGFFRRGKNGDVGKITNPSKFIISEGTLISAILLSEINTDRPGPILARVSHTIRDSRTGQTVLILQNSMLIGEYNSTVGDAQTRAQIMWTRVIFPNQQSVNLGQWLASKKKQPVVRQVV